MSLHYYLYLHLGNNTSFISVMSYMQTGIVLRKLLNDFEKSIIGVRNPFCERNLPFPKDWTFHFFSSSTFYIMYFSVGGLGPKKTNCFLFKKNVIELFFIVFRISLVRKRVVKLTLIVFLIYT